MTDFAYPLFPVLTFLGFILPLIPLSWHLQAWNSGTCYYMIWASIGCLNQFINSVMWRDTAMNLAPVWCDISSRIYVAYSVAIPVASLCINRRLYLIARGQVGAFTWEEKRRNIIIDSLLCLGLPSFVVALSYVVQGHRFNVFEEIGCYPALVNTIPTIFVFEMWPIVIGLVSGTYCAFSLIALFKRQAQFNQFLSTNKAISRSRYMRLMMLAVTDIMFTVPIGIFALLLNLMNGLSPYVSWEDIHFDFGRVALYPAVYWKMNAWQVAALQLTRWTVPFCSFVFFAFFGFAEEARRNYAAAFWFVCRPFAPFARRISSYIFPKQLLSTSTSQATLSVAVTTSACKFDYNKDIEKGPSTLKSQDGCDEVPFTPSSEPLPLYESHPSYARAL